MEVSFAIKLPGIGYANVTAFGPIDMERVPHKRRKEFAIAEVIESLHDADFSDVFPK